MSARSGVVVAAALTLTLGATQARAGDERPLALGGGVGTVGSWFSAAPFSGADLRLSIPVGSRGDVEPIVAWQVPAHGETFAFYGAQYRHQLPGSRSPRFEPFFTAGAIGVFYRERGESMATPPLFALAGFGFEERVSRRLSVRVDTQGIFLVVIPVGVRVAAGVSIPVGRVSGGREARRGNDE